MLSRSAVHHIVIRAVGQTGTWLSRKRSEVYLREKKLQRGEKEDKGRPGSEVAGHLIL